MFRKHNRNKKIKIYGGFKINFRLLSDIGRIVNRKKIKAAKEKGKSTRKAKKEILRDAKLQGDCKGLLRARGWTKFFLFLAVMATTALSTAGLACVVGGRRLYIGLRVDFGYFLGVDGNAEYGRD
jgi:hypothetical protein